MLRIDRDVRAGAGPRTERDLSNNMSSLKKKESVVLNAIFQSGRFLQNLEE